LYLNSLENREAEKVKLQNAMAGQKAPQLINHVAPKVNEVPKKVDELDEFQLCNDSLH
jgi:hypothetical protein